MKDKFNWSFSGSRISMGWLTLIQKVSVTYMHDSVIFVEGLSFACSLSLLVFIHFGLALLHSVVVHFFLYQSLSPYLCSFYIWRKLTTLLMYLYLMTLLNFLTQIFDWNSHSPILCFFFLLVMFFLAFPLLRNSDILI